MSGRIRTVASRRRPGRLFGVVLRTAPDAPVVQAFVDLAERRFPAPKPPPPEF
jgi:hypothetical protein